MFYFNISWYLGLGSKNTEASQRHRVWVHPTSNVALSKLRVQASLAIYDSSKVNEDRKSPLASNSSPSKINEIASCDESLSEGIFCLH